MTPVRLRDSDRFAALLRHCAGPALIEAMKLALPPPFFDRTAAAPADESGRRPIDQVLDAIATALTDSTSRMGAILAGAPQPSAREPEQLRDYIDDFTRRFRKSVYLWALGYLGLGELATATDPDLGEIAAELHEAGGPTERFNLRALVGTRLLLKCVIPGLGPRRLIDGTPRYPFAKCRVEEQSEITQVPRDKTLHLRGGDNPDSFLCRLGWGARVGGSVRLARSKIAITATACPEYFQRADADLSAVMTDWRDAVRALRVWVPRLVPAARRLEIHVLGLPPDSHCLGPTEPGSGLIFGLNDGLSLKPQRTQAPEHGAT